MNRCARAKHRPARRSGPTARPALPGASTGGSIRGQVRNSDARITGGRAPGDVNEPFRKITYLSPNSEIAESYLDVWGHEKRIDPKTREQLERALGPARKPAKV